MRTALIVGTCLAAHALAGPLGAQAPWRLGLVVNRGGPERLPRPGIGVTLGRELLGNGPLRLEIEAGAIYGSTSGENPSGLTFAVSRPAGPVLEPVLRSVATLQAGMVFSPALGGSGSRMFVRASAGGWWSSWTRGNVLHDVGPLPPQPLARGGTWQFGLGAPLPIGDQSTVVEARLQGFQGPQNVFGGRAWSPSPTFGVVVSRLFGQRISP